MMGFGKRMFRYLLFLAPFICGTLGFCVLGRESLMNGMFKSVTMYVMNYGETPPNILVELARWTAPAAAAGSVLLVASSLRERLWNTLHSRRAGAAAVYGPEEEKAPLLAALGKTGVSGGSVPARTRRHILLWDEEENFLFYDKYKEMLAGKDVYLKCRSLPAQAAAGVNLHVFCPEETAARLFWKENFLYGDSAACGHRMRIVLIGFGKLGSELLGSALQNNIFSPEQKIEYHIFGGDSAYLKIHHSLGEIEDPVIFHEDSWQECLPLLESAVRLIVLQQDGQTELLSELLLALPAREIDVFAADSTGPDILDGKERLRCFPWKALACRPENILGEELYRKAKELNLRYAHLYAGVPETEENLDAEWGKLDTFTRYSNISSADYHEIRLKILEAMGEPKDPDRISPDCLELMAELEHMRWCRYHWLANWTFGIPGNGKNKDSVNRIHRDLVPYGRLPEEEKQKDRDTVRMLLELES